MTQNYFKLNVLSVTLSIVKIPTLLWRQKSLFLIFHRNKRKLISNLILPVLSDDEIHAPVHLQKTRPPIRPLRMIQRRKRHQANA